MANWKTAQHISIAGLCGATTLLGAWLCYATGNWVVLLIGVTGLLVNATVEGWLNRTYETLENALDDKLNTHRADVESAIARLTEEHKQTKQQVQEIRNSQIAQAKPLNPFSRVG